MCIFSPKTRCYLAFWLFLLALGCGSAEREAEDAYQEGRQLTEAGQDSQAIAACQSALERNPEHVEAHLLLSDLLLKLIVSG